MEISMGPSFLSTTLKPNKCFQRKSSQICSFSTAGDPREAPDQEGDSGEKDLREYSGCRRHLQEENTGDQVEYAVSKKYLQYSNIFEKIMIYET